MRRADVGGRALPDIATATINATNAARKTAQPRHRIPLVSFVSVVGIKVSSVRFWPEADIAVRCCCMAKTVDRVTCRHSSLLRMNRVSVPTLIPAKGASELMMLFQDSHYASNAVNLTKLVSSGLSLTPMFASRFGGVPFILKSG
jgi:hypothetical protein